MAIEQQDEIYMLGKVSLPDFFHYLKSALKKTKFYI